jgi:glutamine synthetase
MDNTGNNLLHSGDTPEDNLQFLTILVAVIQAVYNYSDLLRASIASAGNEHRLGRNEAPPAIISIFLGEKLETILKNLSKGKKKKITKKDIIALGLDYLPNLSKDNTDRNRTSPFAFTGNKFEFRAVGSSMNISTPITVLNTVVADSLTDTVNRIKNEMKDSDFTGAVLTVLSDIINTCKPVIFNGNNYSKEWIKEAKKRGLENEPSSIKAFQSFKRDKNIKLFEKYSVFSKAELVARYNIWLDIYNKKVDIEGKTLLEIIQTQILPAAYDFQIRVGNSLDVLREMADDESIPIPIHALDERKAMFAKLAADVYYISKQVRDLSSTLKYARKLKIEERALYLYEELKPILDKIRNYIDDLESIMPDSLWNLPKYREMLFIS